MAKHPHVATLGVSTEQVFLSLFREVRLPRWRIQRVRHRQQCFPRVVCIDLV